jgi:glycosyltransferase involved in cell wall biosynthesis
MKVSAGKERLKMLFFSQRFPYPMDTGGQIRTGKLLEKLKDIFDITLISNMESPKDDRYLDQMKDLCSTFHPVPWREIKKYTLKFYLGLLVRMFSRYPVTVIHDYSRDCEAKIVDLLRKEKYDLLICDYLQPSLNFRKVIGYPTVLFQHNIESIIVRRHFEIAQDPVTRLFWWLQWVKMKRYEKLACSRFTSVVAVSEIDKKTLEEEFFARNVFAIPTGVDTEYFAPREDPIEENSLVFTGSMDWLPNEDAMLFFAREILGKIKDQIPTIKLTVVGRNPSRHLLNELKKYPEIMVVGWVEDVRPYIGRHALYIIPLRIGGGTRIKAYEAMAMGKVVVSTRIGTEGLPVRDGEHVVLANEPEDFAQAVVELLRNTEARRRMEKAARQFVSMNFTWEKAAEAFADVCWKITNNRY